MENLVRSRTFYSSHEPESRHTFFFLSYWRENEIKNIIILRCVPRFTRICFSYGIIHNYTVRLALVITPLNAHVTPRYCVLAFTRKKLTFARISIVNYRALVSCASQKILFFSGSRWNPGVWFLSEVVRNHRSPWNAASKSKVMVFGPATGLPELFDNRFANDLWLIIFRTISCLPWRVYSVTFVMGGGWLAIFTLPIKMKNIFQERASVYQLVHDVLAEVLYLYK